MTRANKAIQKKREAVAKGFANHRRIEIMELLVDQGEMMLEDIAKALDIQPATASEHTQRLVRGGQVTKRYKGRHVLHRITPLGRQCLRFLRIVVPQ